MGKVIITGNHYKSIPDTIHVMFVNEKIFSVYLHHETPGKCILKGKINLTKPATRLTLTP